IFRQLKKYALFAVISTVIWAAGQPLQSVTANPVIPRADRPPMYVLQVGIGKYVNAPKWVQLGGPINDVVKMRELLEGERYKVPPENIVTLKDEQGTKETIFKEFQNHLIAKVREHFEKTKKRDAVALFQFSGHGSQVPDVDGDEKDDHLDETLVTYNSQDVKGKNFDITDDEIFALTAELRQYTDNIVYILDSCHSGSGTRDASEAVRRLPVRHTVPESVRGVGAIARGDARSDDNSRGGMLPPGDDYIVITAAAPDETAQEKQCFEECGVTDRPVVYGYLTYYLIDELRNARSDTSYRELMDNVRRRVSSDKLSQTPQIEGDKQRFVFGSLGSHEDNFTRIIESVQRPNGTKYVRIKAGAIQGVSAGTIVSFYTKTDTKFETAAKISSGSVVSVLPGESTVRLIDPRREITTEDKAVIVAPDLGSARLKVNLEVDAEKLTANETKVFSEIRRSLTPTAPQTKEPRGLDLVNPSAGQKKMARWDIAVLKDKFSVVAGKIPAGSDQSFFCHDPSLDPSDSGYKKISLAASKGLSKDREVIYIAGKDYAPLYRFCMETNFLDETSQRRAAARIEDALVHLVRLKTVNGIANNRSTLKDFVVVKAVRLIGPFGCENGRFKAASYETVAADKNTGRYNFVPDEVFWFEVTNRSPKDLYLTLLNLGSDGSVKLYSPRTVSEDKDGVVIAKNGGRRILMSENCRTDENGNFTEAGPFRSSGPSGIDKFKFIATVDRTIRDDFAYLEMPALARRGNAATLAGMTDWTTVDIEFEITESKK
ncbi:MAG: caspase family protein, partial [Pyrinomonadaceae bacterium]